MLPDNLTGLIAHPDDEVLFLWPMLGRVKLIVSVVSDAFNKEREWCSKRRQAFKEVGKLYGFKTICLDYNSAFYRYPTRNAPYKDTLKYLTEDVLKHIPETCLFTHNQFGEYGHLDHMLVHQLAVHTGQPVYFTDTVIEMNWLPFKKFPPRLRYNNAGTYARDEEKFKRAKEIYVKHDCWTWSKPTPTECKVLCT